MTEELFRRALASVPAIRRGLEALESATRLDDPGALAKAASLLQEAAGAAEDGLMPSSCRWSTLGPER
ncbi:MAG: hypothetical protein QME70_10010 [Bacillota bacterium]|nr:hypothetical protein [Bacillota bacterium]